MQLYDWSKFQTNYIPVCSKFQFSKMHWFRSLTLVLHSFAWVLFFLSIVATYVEDGFLFASADNSNQPKTIPVIDVCKNFTYHGIVLLNLISVLLEKLYHISREDRSLAESALAATEPGPAPRDE